jgi:hypothetical protein
MIRPSATVDLSSARTCNSIFVEVYVTNAAVSGVFEQLQVVLLGNLIHNGRKISPRHSLYPKSAQ